MRNWNRCPGWAAEAGFLVLSLPMRNWNRLTASKSSGSRYVLSLPMRNWNTVGTGISSPTRVVLSLPMRNWNLYYTCLPLSTPSGFEPTYEELKQHSRPVYDVFLYRFWAYLWGIETSEDAGSHNLSSGFEPTYEELKQVQYGWIKLHRQSFEPTYEELKQKFVHISRQFRDLFWAYLWGIETGTTIGKKSRLPWFWAYLWGIETGLIPSRPEVKPEFWAYLWGIETTGTAWRESFP